MAKEDMTSTAEAKADEAAAPVETKSADAPAADPDGVIMEAPEGATEFCWNGFVHRIEEGLAIVPHAAVEALKSHGFKLPS